jgi:hypothetical protein
MRSLEHEIALVTGAGAECGAATGGVVAATSDDEPARDVEPQIRLRADPDSGGWGNGGGGGGDGSGGGGSLAAGGQTRVRGKDGKARRSLGFARVRSRIGDRCNQAVLANGRERLLALAMQKVEGSSPIIRSSAKPRNRGALVSQGTA